jgi:PAS domain S-box-containing protein
MEEIIRRLDESSTLLDIIFEEAPVGLGLWDRDLRCLRVNRALADMSGLPGEAHIGKTMGELFPHIDPSVMESFQQIIATGVPILNREDWGRTPSPAGKERLWSSSFYPVRVRDEIIGVGAICEEITERRKAEQLLRASEAQFRQIADGLPQLVWTTLPDGSNDYFNRRWYEYTGCSLDDSQCIGWKQILHPDDQEATLRAWRHSLETGHFYENEHRFRRSDGVYRWFLGRAVPILDERNAIVRWFGTCTDIDEQKRNVQALRQAKCDLEQFAYSASHDLQEPLRNITAFTQLLKKQYAGKLDGDADLYIGYVVGGAKRMENLIRGLLSYTQVADVVEQPGNPVDANEVLHKAVANLSATIAANRAVVTSDRLPKVPLHEMHLLQLFQNLIGNGIKYRSEEDPRIHISARTEGGWTIFSVRDNGIGIDRQFADRIFGIFRRLHSGDKYEGTGIGLAICQKIVERHGGRIWMESELGKGSLFQFSLPGGGDL